MKKKLTIPTCGAIVVIGIILFCVLLRVTGLGLYLLSFGPVVDGQEGRIVTHAPSAIVARDVASLDAVVGAPLERVAEMQTAGQLFLVDENTRVLVLSAGARYDHIQILTGEYAGATGYVPASFISR